MAKIQPTVLESGIFASPATGRDAPYQLWQQPNGDLTVICLETRTHHPISTLAQWTHSDIASQRRAFVRELAAWLYINGPKDDERAAAAVAEVGRLLAAHYNADDLDSDRHWLDSHDLSVRVPILRQELPEASRRELIEFCGRVARVGKGISPSDAQFIEVLGRGLGLDADVVTAIVIAAVQQQAQTQAAA